MLSIFLSAVSVLTALYVAAKVMQLRSAITRAQLAKLLMLNLASNCGSVMGVVVVVMVYQNEPYFPGLRNWSVAVSGLSVLLFVALIVYQSTSRNTVRTLSFENRFADCHC